MDGPIRYTAPENTIIRKKTLHFQCGQIAIAYLLLMKFCGQKMISGSHVLYRGLQVQEQSLHTADCSPFALCIYMNMYIQVNCSGLRRINKQQHHLCSIFLRWQKSSPLRSWNIKSLTLLGSRGPGCFSI